MRELFGLCMGDKLPVLDMCLKEGNGRKEWECERSVEQQEGQRYMCV